MPALLPLISFVIVVLFIHVISVVVDSTAESYVSAKIVGDPSTRSVRPGAEDRALQLQPCAGTQVGQSSNPGLIEKGGVSFDSQNLCCLLLPLNHSAYRQSLLPL